MILSNVDIKKALSEGKITITPDPEPDQYTSSSLDLRIGDEFKIYPPELFSQKGVGIEVTYFEFDYKKFSAAYLEDLQWERDGSVIIPPKAFILATTLERITLHMNGQIAARVEGRSSIARLGLVVHLSSPTIHAGYSGKITLEIINNGFAKVKLTPKKDRICQLIFEQLSSKPDIASKEQLSQFQGQDSVTGVSLSNNKDD